MKIFERFLMRCYILHLTYVRDRLIQESIRRNMLKEDMDTLMDRIKENQMRINMNDMAKIVADREQGDQVNIAQIKEVMRIFLEELARYQDEEILEVVKRYK